MKHATSIRVLFLIALAGAHGLPAQHVAAVPLRGAFTAMDTAVITNDPVGGDSVLKIRTGGTEGVTLWDYPTPPSANIPDFNISKIKLALQRDIQVNLLLPGLPTFEFVVDGLSTGNDLIPVYWDGSSFRIMDSQLWAATSVGVERGVTETAGSYLESLNGDTGFEILSYYAETAPVFGFLQGQVYLEESRDDMAPQQIPPSRQLTAHDPFIPLIFWNGGNPSPPLMPEAHVVYFTITEGCAANIRQSYGAYRINGREVRGNTVFGATWNPASQEWSNLSVLVDHTELGYGQEVDVDALGVGTVSAAMVSEGTNLPLGGRIVTYSLTAATTPAGEDQIMIWSQLDPLNNQTAVRSPLMTKGGVRVSTRFGYSSGSDTKLICNRDPELGADSPMISLPDVAPSASAHLSLFRTMKQGPTLRAVVSAKVLVKAVTIIRIAIGQSGGSFSFDLPLFVNGPRNCYQFDLPANLSPTPTVYDVQATIFTSNGTATSYPVKIRL